MINTFKDSVNGKRVLVVGSETPWIEAIILAVGAQHVLTMEYNKIVSTHPQVGYCNIDASIEDTVNYHSLNDIQNSAF